MLGQCGGSVPARSGAGAVAGYIMEFLQMGITVLLKEGVWGKLGVNICLLGGVVGWLGFSVSHGLDSLKCRNTTTGSGWSTKDAF